MRRPNHASRFEGIAKTKLQASRASDTETLQSQVNKAAQKRLSLSGLEVLHGRELIQIELEMRGGNVRGDRKSEATLRYPPKSRPDLNSIEMPNSTFEEFPH